MKPPPNSPRAKWRVVIIAEKSVDRFAYKLETALQQLSDDGWQMMSREYRGTDLIITACRIEAEPVQVGPRLPQPPPRRVIPHDIKNEPYNEVLYSYSPGPGHEVVTKKFDSMLAALRLLKEHLEGDWPLPIKLVRCALTIYDVKAIPGLLRLYAKELQHDHINAG